MAKPRGIETTNGYAGRACRRIPGDLSGGNVACLSACVSKLGRAWFFISGTACTGKAWPRCRGNGDSWGICRNAIKPASTRSAPGSVGGLWQVITASGQAGPDVGKLRLRFGDATSGTTDQLQWPVQALSTTLNPLRTAAGSSGRNAGALLDRSTLGEADRDSKTRQRFSAPSSIPPGIYFTNPCCVAT